MFLMGFDIGGTKMEAVILELGGVGGERFYHPEKGVMTFRIHSRHRRATERERGFEVVLNNLESLTREALEKAALSLDDLTSMGFALPGSIDPKTQEFVTGNTLAFKNQFVAKSLVERIGFKKAYLSENDANCFVLAEALMGSGLEHQNKNNKSFSDLIGLGIILGTGCGGGILIHGKLLRGKQGGGGEVGHTLLVSNGHACFCGNEGCAEQYLSGPALEASFMRRRYTKIQDITDSRQIFEFAHNGEPISMAVIKRYRGYLSSFLANLATVFDPDYFVLGGGISDQDMIYDGLEEQVVSKTFLKKEKVPIYKSQTGASGGVLGAALLPLLENRV